MRGSFPSPCSRPDLCPHFKNVVKPLTPFRFTAVEKEQKNAGAARKGNGKKYKIVSSNDPELIQEKKCKKKSILLLKLKKKLVILYFFYILSFKF